MPILSVPVASLRYHSLRMVSFHDDSKAESVLFYVIRGPFTNMV